MMEMYGKIVASDARLVKDPVVAAPISPYATRFLTPNGYVTVFHIRPAYYRHVNGQWRPIDEVAYSGNRRIHLKENWTDMDLGYLRWLIKRADLLNGAVLVPSPYGEPVKLDELRSIHFTTSTFYPDPHPETTCVDGFVGQSYASGGPQNWATIRAAVGNNYRDDATSDSGFMFECDPSPNTYRELRRGVFLFDTSAIPDGDTITSATLSLYGFSSQDQNSYAPNINVYACAPGSSTFLTGSDYSTFASANFSTSIAFASFSLSAYNDFVLNASGIAAISKTGITKLGTRNVNYDIDNVSPSWQDSAKGRIEVYMSETATSDYDPKLTVEHSGAAGTTKHFLNILGTGA